MKSTHKMTDGESNRAKELDHLRKEISNLTLSVLKLLKNRQDIVQKVARIKESENLPVEDLAVEKRLRSRVIESAKRIALDETLASRVFDALLDSSKNAQRREMNREKIISFLQKNKIETVSIVGAGRMGGWFAGYFKELQRDVTLTDSKTSLAKLMAKKLGCRFARKANGADLVVVAVPISQTRQEIKKLQERKLAKAIIEISSIKGKGFPRSSGDKIPILSIHPMFGSSAQYFGDNCMVFIQEADQNSMFQKNFVKQLFPQFQIVRLTARAHDKQMALTLSLPHTLALAFGDVLLRDSNLIGSKKITSQSFSAMKELATKVFSENSKVYFEIQSENEFSSRVLRHLGQAVRSLSDFFKNENETEFTKYFAKRRQALQSN
jgi:prephenate dehydrogenase/chorismate mutase